MKPVEFWKQFIKLTKSPDIKRKRTSISLHRVPPGQSNIGQNLFQLSWITLYDIVWQRRGTRKIKNHFEAELKILILMKTSLR